MRPICMFSRQQRQHKTGNIALYSVTFIINENVNYFRINSNMY